MNSAPRVLIIDDEVTIRNVLRLNLEGEGYQIAEAADGQSGIEKTSQFHPHLIILDLGLPDLQGFEVLRDLRRWTKIPIIVLTVTDDENTKVKLLDAGADDYLTKPFRTPELLARVRVGLRNHGLAEATPIFESDDLRIDINQRLVTIDGARIKLSHTEYEVLARLVREHGKVVPQAQILKEIWSASVADQGHYLRIYINQLRKKLEKKPSEPRHIITEPGIGYRLV